ncbi:hypothetical protein P3L10_004726 [Capsicum annuum]
MHTFVFLFIAFSCRETAWNRSSSQFVSTIANALDKYVALRENLSPPLLVLPPSYGKKFLMFMAIQKKRVSKCASNRLVFSSRNKLKRQGDHDSQMCSIKTRFGVIVAGTACCICCDRIFSSSTDALGTAGLGFTKYRLGKSVAQNFDNSKEQMTENQVLTE